MLVVELIKLLFFSLDQLYILQTLKTQKSNYIKLKKTDGGKQSFSKLTGSGSGQISARIQPESDPDLFF